MPFAAVVCGRYSFDLRETMQLQECCRPDIRPYGLTCSASMGGPCSQPNRRAPSRSEASREAQAATRRPSLGHPHAGYSVARPKAH